MNQQTKPSAGALRAARAFNSIPRGWNKSNPVEELAEIIDRESGLAELLEACKLALAYVKAAGIERTDSGDVAKIRRAIANVENPNSTVQQVSPAGRWTEKGTV